MNPIDLLRKLLPNGVTPYLIARIRTLVPIGVGAAVTYADQTFARHGVLVSIDSATLGIAATSIASGAYYVIVRALEKRWPRYGWLLGYPSQPTY